MNFFRIFRRKATKEVRPLRIDGAGTALTPAPDDAELAAQALLESQGGKPRRGREGTEPAKGTPEYYRRLAERIRENRAAEARLTMRYLAYCEEQLALPKELYVGQTEEMEKELYRRQDIAEREGGELLRRWQRCLAEVIVRQMSAAGGTAVDSAATEEGNG